MKCWFVARNGARSGPFTIEELRRLVAQGQLGPNDHVFKTGSPTWVRAGSVAGLFPAAIPPPPVQRPPGMGGEFTVVTNARRRTVPRRKVSRTSQTLLPMLVVGVPLACCALILGLVVVLKNVKPRRSAATEVAETLPRDATDNALDDESPEDPSAAPRGEGLLDAASMSRTCAAQAAPLVAATVLEIWDTNDRAARARGAVTAPRPFEGTVVARAREVLEEKYLDVLSPFDGRPMALLKNNPEFEAQLRHIATTTGFQLMAEFPHRVLVE